MKSHDLQIRYTVVFGTDLSIVCTCLVVRETSVPSHTLRLQMWYPIRPDFTLYLREIHESTLGANDLEPRSKRLRLW